MRDGHGGVTCNTCNLSQCDHELRNGKCCRCATDPDAERPRRIDEEIGYRRGFQQGYAAALERFGGKSFGDRINTKIYKWRTDWKSIAKCAEDYPTSEWPHFAWEAAGRYIFRRGTERTTP